MADRPRIRVWRVAVFLLIYVTFCGAFDVAVPDVWVNVTVGAVYGLFLELTALPTFGLAWVVGEIRAARRELRRLRREGPGNG